MNEPVFINPFTDFGFKKIFGEEQNKDLLIDFLNELLAAQNQHISDLVFKKNDRLGVSDLDRRVIFDLYCENEKGEKFTVELQKAKQSFFKDRMVFYSSFSIQEQGRKGEWDYHLKAVYVIAILDFIIDEDNVDKIVVSKNQIMDVDRQQVFYDKLTFVTLQMPNFTKEEHQLETNFDKWLYVIKNLHRLDRIPERLQEKIFQKLFKVAAYTALSKEEKDKYEDSVKYYNDLKNSLDTAQQQGFDQASTVYEAKLEEMHRQKEEERRQKEEERRQKEEERRQKEEERRQKEETQQKLQEERQQKAQMLLKMYKSGLTMTQLIDFSGYPEAEVKRIIDELNDSE